MTDGGRLMKRIGIIGAMESEVTGFCHSFHAVETETKGIFKGSHADKEVYISLSGIGKVNAAIAAQRLVDLYSVECIINSGVAGGIYEKLSKLDIVISEKLTYHDFTPLDILDRNPPYGSVMTADKKLVELASCACKKLNDSLVADNKQPFSAYVGTVVSGDCFVSSSEKVKQLREDFDAYCTEMEGAAIAHVSKVNGIPFVVIRAISDFADEEAEGSFESFETVAAKRAEFITAEMIAQL